MFRRLWNNVPMHMDWNLFVTALGLALVLEGLPYALFAEKLPAVLAALARRGAPSLRIMGLAAIGAGVLLVWLARG